MITEWDLLAIIIALFGAGVVVYYSIKQNIALQKEVRRLQLALRDERKKKSNKKPEQVLKLLPKFWRPVIHRLIHRH